MKPQSATLPAHPCLLRLALACLTGLPLLLPLLLPRIAHAHFAEDICTRNPVGTQTLSANVNVGQDAAVNDVIGPWFQFPVYTWTCKRSKTPGYQPANDRHAARLNVTPDAAGLAAGSTINVDGENYQVYILAQKIGYIARIQRQMLDDPAPAPFTPLTVKPGQSDIQDSFSGGPRETRQSFQFRITLQIRFVKIRADMTASNSNYNYFLWLPLRFYTRTYTPVGNAWVMRPLYRNRLNVRILSTNAACVTPAQTVDLGKVHSHNLKNPWDTGSTTEFSLKFNQCPPSMGVIKYQFQPVPAQTISDGVLPLIPPSDATGVGVQVLAADRSPLPFNAPPMELTAYRDTALNPLPTYEIPLKAHIIRLPGQLGSGHVHAAMRMVVRYQ